MHIYMHTHTHKTRTQNTVCPLKLTACAWICATVLVFQPRLVCFIFEFVLDMQVSAGLFGSHAVQQLNISGIAVWLTLKTTRFSLGLLLKATVFLSFSSMYQFWQGVVTSCFYQAKWQVMSTVSYFNLTSGIFGTFNFVLLYILKSLAVCWYYAEFHTE